MPLEFLLFLGILRDDKVFGSEAIFLFGWRKVIAVLGIIEALGVTLVLVPFRGVGALLGLVIAKLPQVV